MILRRLAHLVIVLFFVTLFVALLTAMLPGDPVDAIAGFASPEQKEALRQDLQLDDPVWVQYGRWVGHFVTGDLGNNYSVTGGRPVADRVKDALPVSLQLMIEAQILALVIAIPLGVFTAYRAGSRFDKGANATAFGLLAIPNFAVALVPFLYDEQLAWFVYDLHDPSGLRFWRYHSDSDDTRRRLTAAQTR